MKCLSTDVLILFNSSEPVKLVHKLLLNSSIVQRLFKTSCYMIPNIFDIEENLAIDKSPVCYLFQFLVQGFIRVYSKDIYQHRLSNVLLSKTGASGIRTALLTLSAEAHKKKNVTSDSTTNSQAVPVEKLREWLVGEAYHIMFYILECNKSSVYRYSC